jgi:tetratricopeptide (TPR) repeat protein
MNVKSLILIPLLLLTCGAMAQDNPPRGGPGGGGPGGGGGPRNRDGIDNPPPFNDGRGPGGGGRGGPGGGGGNPLMMQVELMRNWLDLIDRYAKLSRDPVSAGVAAVVSADDLLRAKPPEQAIEFFNKMLDEAKNDTVKRAIRLQLAELYGKANQSDKALEQLRKLMSDAPANPTATAAPPALAEPATAGIK